MKITIYGGERLLLWRQDHGIKQQALGDKLGYDKYSLTLIERGLVIPSDPEKRLIDHETGGAVAFDLWDKSEADIDPGQWIALWCRRKKISQQKAAVLVGIHPTTLSQIVRGKKPTQAQEAKLVKQWPALAGQWRNK